MSSHGRAGYCEWKDTQLGIYPEAEFIRLSKSGEEEEWLRMGLFPYPNKSWATEADDLLSVYRL